MECALIVVLLVFILNFAGSYQYKVCPSLDYEDLRYADEDKKFAYGNCTHINGNLLISGVREESDLSYLEHIKDVTGYVYISDVRIPRLVLPNLAIIRGRSLMDTKWDRHGLRLALLLTGDEATIELPALREISAGNVRIFNYYNNCFMNSVKWEEILRDTDKQNVTFSNPISPERCPPCHQNCSDGCWGPGPLSCQKVSKINCSRECRGRRCFGPNPTECCHSFCAGGCSGPTASDCFACKNVNDSGVCKEECLPMQIYNPATDSLVRNPDGKYAYGGICVEDCPEHHLIDSGWCVESCPDTKKEVDGECVPCGDSHCPKVCSGGQVLPQNIHYFQGCTTIDEYLRIDYATFETYTESDNRSFTIHPDALEVFSTLREVTGFLEISANHTDFKNLSYFRNLQIIHGGNYGLRITETSLESLNLRSLCEVRTGDVIIRNNPKLCFASGIDWEQLMGSNSEYNAGVDIQDNAEEGYCRERGLVCHEQCSTDGCWGTGPEECLWSGSYKLNGTCVLNVTEL